MILIPGHVVARVRLGEHVRHADVVQGAGDRVEAEGAQDHYVRHDLCRWYDICSNGLLMLNTKRQNKLDSEVRTMFSQISAALVYQPCCLVPCCHGKPEEHAKNSLQNLLYSSFCHLLVTLPVSPPTPDSTRTASSGRATAPSPRRG